MVGVGSIVPCPKEVVNTGFIFVVGDATKCESNQSQPAGYRWDYKAVEYDPINRVRIGKMFSVSKEEMERWSKNI